MGTAGFILLYRQITEWEWYQNPNTFRLFLHILLKANFKDSKFQGKDIRRGQLITSLPKLSNETRLSIQQTRTALKHLISTGEITDEGTSQYRVITVVKYDDYQKSTDEATDDQQTNNRQNNSQSTDNQQQYKNNNKDIKEKWNNQNSIFVVPTVDDVERYCLEKGIYGFDAEKFVAYYSSNGWMVGRNRMKDWGAAIRLWLRNDQEREQQRRAAANDDLPL